MSGLMTLAPMTAAAAAAAVSETVSSINFFWCQALNFLGKTEKKESISRPAEMDWDEVVIRGRS